MTKVVVEPDESFESALRRFEKSCDKARLLSEFKMAKRRERTSD